MHRAISLLWLLLAGPGAPAETATGKLELTVKETAGIQRFGYPVHVVLALPRDVTEKDRLRLRTGKKALHAIGGAGFKSRIVRQGPLAVALRLEGETILADNKKAASTVEMTFPRSKSWVEVSWTLRGDVKPRDMLEVDLNLLV